MEKNRRHESLRSYIQKSAFLCLYIHLLKYGRGLLKIKYVRIPSNSFSLFFLRFMHYLSFSLPFPPKLDFLVTFHFTLKYKYVLLLFHYYYFYFHNSRKSINNWVNVKIPIRANVLQSRRKISTWHRFLKRGRGNEAKVKITFPTFSESWAPTSLPTCLWCSELTGPPWALALPGSVPWASLTKLLITQRFWLCSVQGPAMPTL